MNVVGNFQKYHFATANFIVHQVYSPSIDPGSEPMVIRLSFFLKRQQRLYSGKSEPIIHLWNDPVVFALQYITIGLEWKPNLIHRDTLRHLAVY